VNYPVPRAQGVGTPPPKILRRFVPEAETAAVLAFNIKFYYLSLNTSNFAWSHFPLKLNFTLTLRIECEIRAYKGLGTAAASAHPSP